MNEREAYENLDRAERTARVAEKQAMVAEAGCSGFGDLLLKWMDGDQKAIKAVSNAWARRVLEG